RGLPPPWAYRGAFFFVALVGCHNPAPSAPTETRAPARPFSLAAAEGRIWSPRRHAFVDRATVEAEANATRFVLLGEKHDHAEHHRLQRDLLASIAKTRAPAVVFEMVDVDDQPKIDAAPHDADALAEAVGWSARGWSWPLYKPIVALALEKQLPIVAGNFPRAKIKSIFHSKEDPIDPETRKSLGIDRPLPDALERDLEDELAASHCGKLPKEMLPAFALAQRLRDGQMAERLRTRATKDGAVLIAGEGHVRRDRGVPWYLPANETYAIGFVELESGKTDPKDYGDLYDAVWFTSPAPREDPCGK
ncbi:MAG: ChaN family lipoprotein, partial [Polyangiales bacterium]